MNLACLHCHPTTFLQFTTNYVEYVHNFVLYKNIVSYWKREYLSEIVYDFSLEYYCDLRSELNILVKCRQLVLTVLTYRSQLLNHMPNSVLVQAVLREFRSLLRRYICTLFSFLYFCDSSQFVLSNFATVFNL